MKIIDELLISCDDNMPSVLIPLDLSAAFDTVDHDLLLFILRTEIGIEGIALDWFRSFLIGRNCKVKINSSYSDPMEIEFGVPQGSVLGPILFSIYIRSLYKLEKVTKFSINGFADDNQLSKQFLIHLQYEALGECIKKCIDEVSHWMRKHFLCLNTDKTKIMIIAPPDIQKQVTIRGVNCTGTCIRFSDIAKNLGILFDSTLSLDEHIRKVARSCYYIIRNISEIKEFLSKDQLKTLVCTRVLLKLDYCNALYFGLNSYSIKILQRVQNSALRLI